MNPGFLAAGLLAGMLAGCGGGESAVDTPTARAVERQTPTPAVLRVEPRVQPAAASQDVASIKSRAASAAPAPTSVVLDALQDSRAIAAAAPPTGARQVGVARTVDAASSVAALRSRLDWQPTAGGGRIAAVSFSSGAARGLRLGVLIEQLPGSSVLRLYSQARRETVFEISGHEVLQTIDRNLAAGDTGDAARTWWSPDFGSPEVTLEIELPPGTPVESVRLSVPTLSHIFVELELPTAGNGRETAKDIGDSDSCERDAVCDPAYAGTANAVARMTFVENGSAYLCTGTLLNDATSSGAPYLLSAAHCIDTQSTASTLQTDWFFHAQSCNSRALSNERQRRLRGAALLYVSSNTDTSFMLLNDSPPVNATYSGWDAAVQPPGSGVVTLHHPAGDLLKISYGTLDGFSGCTAPSPDGSFSCSTGTASSGNSLRVNWSTGTTEAGSSGAGLFYRTGASSYLIGTLQGGSTACYSPYGSDYYGRFDIAFQVALKQWLDTPSTGPGPAGRTAVYRFFNSRTGTHFYTASVGERDFVIATYPVFRYEGPAFYAYPGNAAGQSPVYRFFNSNTGAHFYTIDAAERDAVARNPGFRYEGVSWYAQTGVGGGSTPVYRFFNRDTGTHFYSINAQERNYVLDVYPQFNYEGIGYYAWADN